MDPLTPPPDFTDFGKSHEFYYREDGDGASLDRDLLAMGDEDSEPGLDFRERMVGVDQVHPAYTVAQGASSALPSSNRVALTS